jgi:hypothetical protein
VHRAVGLKSRVPDARLEVTLRVVKRSLDELVSKLEVLLLVDSDMNAELVAPCPLL